MKKNKIKYKELCKMSNDIQVQLLAKTSYLDSWLRFKTVAKFSLLFPFKKFKITTVTTCLAVMLPRPSVSLQLMLGYSNMYRLFWLTWPAKAVRWFSQSTSLTTVYLDSCYFYYLDLCTKQEHVGRRNNCSLSEIYHLMNSHRSFYWFRKKWIQNPRPDFL